MVTATSATTLPTSTSTVATKIHHTKKKEKKKTAHPLPSSSKSQNNRHHNHKTQISEKKENNHKTRIGEKKEERQSGKLITPASKTHTHTQKPTTANFHKSKPIMTIHCTTTHYDPNTQPTISLPLDSTHTPAIVTTTHTDHNPKSQTHNPNPANHNSKSQTHNPYPHRSQFQITNPQPRPTPITIQNHKPTTHWLKTLGFKVAKARNSGLCSNIAIAFSSKDTHASIPLPEMVFLSTVIFINPKPTSP